jgi:hypothetical protein
MNPRTRYLQSGSVRKPDETPELSFGAWFALLTPAEQTRYRSAELAHITNQAHARYSRRGP